MDAKTGIYLPCYVSHVIPDSSECSLVYKKKLYLSTTMKSPY